MSNLTLIKPQMVQNIINKFCYTIGMIPTSYKLALTYEEQILAIGKYLEETVYPAINSNAEALAELQNLFVDLKNYVDNYFDNLDVQEEINNKLDEMAEDGTLQELITAYLQLNGVLGFNTINDMKLSTNLIEGSFAQTFGYNSLNDLGGAKYKIRAIRNTDIIDNKSIIALQNENLVAELINDDIIKFYNTITDLKNANDLISGDYVETKGFHSINDRGNAKYLIRNKTNDDIIDEMFIISIDENLVAELFYNNEIEPEQIGCYGDGINDDTLKFKSLINYLQNKNITLKGSGIYYLTEQINFGNINIEMPSATIKSSYGIKLNCSNKHINLPSIINENTENLENIGVEIFNCYETKFTINYITGFRTGLKLSADNSGCCYNLIEILFIRNCLNGIILENSTSGWVNENTFLKGRIFNDSNFIENHGSDINLISLLGNSSHSCNNNYFLNTCIEGGEGIYNGVKIKLRYASYNVFEALRYEGTEPKIDSLDCHYNILNNGYGVGNLQFINDEVPININDNSYVNHSVGSINGCWKDIRPASNNYPIFKLRRTNNIVGTEIYNDKIINYNSSGDKSNALTFEGFIGYYNDEAFYMLRPYGRNVMFPNCDGENQTLVISPANSFSGACRLWVNNGHLYGKMGAPSSPTDGTIII